MAADGWRRKFGEPIVTPDGMTLKTLRDAVKYLAKTVPSKEREMPAVMTAAEMLTRAAEGSDAWMMFARMGVMKALHRHEKRVFNLDRKDHHWGKRKLKRDE
jgi:hypothetical protein